jgi:HK97 family phage portal protein
VARDSWQWYRLHEAPNSDQSAFDFWQDASASVETFGNAYIWKAIGRRPVQSEEDIELHLVDPAAITLRRDRDTNQKFYEVRRFGRTDRVPASQILLIRGWTVTPGADLGVSPVSLHRETLGSVLAAREYQARFFANGTSLPGFIKVPGMPDQGELDRLNLEWQQRHAGLLNAHRPAFLVNGAEWQSTGLSMQDSQYIEIQKFNGEEVCRIFRINPGMVGFLTGTRPVPADDDFERFLKADMAPRLRRIEMALRADPDMFPSGGDLFPKFETGAVLKPSTQSRAAAYKDFRQAGIMTANEIRALEDLPPAEGGDVLQDTPVGGAPNAMPEPTVSGSP